MIERAVKAVILVLCPFLGYGLGLSFYDLLSASDLDGGIFYFTGGFLIFWIFWLVARRRLVFVCTLEHEITHLLFGLLFLKLPRGFRVTLRDGGHVRLKGSNFLIYLAPYFFPTISFALVILILLVPFERRSVPYALLGASAAFHLASTWADLRPGQSDLRKAGLIFSLFFLPAANLATYGSLMAFVTGGMNGISSFWASAWRYTTSLAAAISGG